MKRISLAMLSVGVASMALLALAGCSQPSSDPAAPGAAAGTLEGDGVTDDHSGWWCAEHGVPEEECSMCSSTAAADFKAKGDWCETHNRAHSQCFVCDPSQAEKFVKLYEAKFGTKPPPAAE
jgi:hypothetical protein